MPATQTSLSFQDSKKHQSSAVLTEPSLQTDSIAILCHGFLSNKHSNTNRRLSELLPAKGINTFSFDWYGMGESEGSFADVTVGRCCDQLEQALAFVRDKGYSRIGLIGSSFGGLISLLVAARHADLVALGLKCPVPDFPEMLRLEFGEAAMNRWQKTGEIPNVTGVDHSPIALHYSFYEDCLKYDAFDAATRITAPALIVHGDQDELVPLHQIHGLERSLAGPTQLCLLEGANHHFARPEDFRKMTTMLADYIVTHLTSK